MKMEMATIVATTLIYLAIQVSADLPTLDAPKSYAPDVPAPITRTYPAHLRLGINATVVKGKLNGSHEFEFWAFDGHVPGPFVRARVGDILEVTLTNSDISVAHDIDFHAVSGPGGGGPVLRVEPGQSATGSFLLRYPGLFIYHCGVPPAPHHLANGLYGLILVEPPEGMPKVDREYYVMKSEFYTKADGPNSLKPSYEDGLDEKPSHVVFNGRAESLTLEPLVAKTDERVRVFFGNAGPNQIASFHIIGIIFDQVYREGDLISEPGRGIQTTLVPAGGAAVVEFKTPVPGTYTLVDHSLFRALKGAIGHLKVDGPPRLDVYCPSKPRDNSSCDVKANFTPAMEYVDKRMKLNVPLTSTPQSMGNVVSPSFWLPSIFCIRLLL